MDRRHLKKTKYISSFYKKNLPKITKISLKKALAQREKRVNVYRYNTAYLSEKDNQISYLVDRKYPNSCDIVHDKIQLKSVENNELKEKIVAYLSELCSKPEEEINDLYTNARRQEEIESKRQREEQERLKEAHYFFNKPSSNATENELEYWAKMSYWATEEALALLFGKNPTVVNWDKIKNYKDKSPFAKDYGKIRELILRAISTNELKCSKSLVGLTPTTIKPADVLSWAKKKGIQVNGTLEKTVSEQNKEITDYKTLYQDKCREKCLEIETLVKKVENLEQECKQYKQKKASLQRSLNTSDKLFAAVVKEKFLDNVSIISNVQSCLQKQGIHADDETIRDRYKRGLEIIKQKTED